MSDDDIIDKPKTKPPDWRKLRQRMDARDAEGSRPRIRRNKPSALIPATPFTFNRAHDPIPSTKFNARSIAQDQNISVCTAWAGDQFAQAQVALGAMGSAFLEGVTWLGYPYLSELAQRVEYRNPASIIADNMTRKWIKINGPRDKVQQLEAEMTRLQVKEAFRAAAYGDLLFGRHHLYIDIWTNGRPQADDRSELITDIGDGTSELSRAKIPIGSLKAIRPVEAIWTYPTTYDSIDPLKDDWYAPTQWFVMGKQVHTSRIMRFVGREVPDILKPMYQFGGISMSQMIKPYVDNWLRSRQAVSDLVHSFSVWKLLTDLSETLNMSGDQLFERIELFNDIKDNQGLFVLNKDTEDLGNVSCPLGGLENLQAQNQEHMASATRVPNIILFGLSPIGMQASNEGEIGVFYDHIRGFQRILFQDNLDKVFRYVQLSLWGAVDPSLTYDFETLYELDEKQRAETRKAEADCDQILVDTGVLHPEEVRQRVHDDPLSGYADIDVDDVPDLKEEEEQGLFPRGGGGGVKAVLGGHQRSTNTRTDGVGGAHQDPNTFGVGGIHHMNRHAQDDEPMTESQWNSLLQEYGVPPAHDDDPLNIHDPESKGYFVYRDQCFDDLLDAALRKNLPKFDEQWAQIEPFVERLEAEQQIEKDKPNPFNYAEKKWCVEIVEQSPAPERFTPEIMEQLETVEDTNEKVRQLIAADQAALRAAKRI
jgi:phage-related protein (TIGR01555 family)